MQPMVGQIIHLTEVNDYELDGFRLNWRSDNTARVSRIAPPEIPNATRCSLHATCQVAALCAAGKPHAPDIAQDSRNQCYDHKPYVPGGVTVWGVLANARIDRPEGARKD